MLWLGVVVVIRGGNDSECLGKRKDLKKKNLQEKVRSEKLERSAHKISSSVEHLICTMLLDLGVFILFSF